MLALFESLEKLAAFQPAVCPLALAAASSLGDTSDVAAAKLYCMADTLAELDRHPDIAALGVQQRVARLLCDGCQGLVVSLR